MARCCIPWLAGPLTELWENPSLTGDFPFSKYEFTGETRIFRGDPMKTKQFTRLAAKWLAAGIGISVASYATYVGVAWFRYGTAKRAAGDEADALLDRFMPDFEVRERHKVHVAAPAAVALTAATEIDLESCAIIRAIFKGREWILHSKPDNTLRPRGLLAQTKSLGWGLLAELPGREIVMGSVTKPWEANAVFRALPADEFAAFQEPGYVKIVWTLRADPAGEVESVFRTETRAAATDPEAREKFRWYWSFLSPGIIAIRTVMLPAVKAEAERRWRDIRGFAA
jgi:hypothetical protein